MSLPLFTLNTSTSRQDAIGASFAYDVTRRIAQSKELGDVQTSKNLADPSAALDDEQAAAQTEKRAQLQKLEEALSGSVAYMRGKHGEKAANVMIALVYKRLGSEEINEQTLGDAFLDVTRFIDKNFGTSAGDAFMAHLNGSLNDTMNTFFDNGQSEIFMVAPTSSSGGGGIDPAGLLEALTKEYTEVIKEMLEDARAKPEEGDIASYADPLRKESMLGVMADVMV